MFEEFSKAWNGLTEGLSCTVPTSAKRGELNVNENGEVISDDELDEDKLTSEELKQRFVAEACHVKETAEKLIGADQAVAVIKRWEKRLKGSRAQESLKALLQGRAIDILLLALTKSESGRLAMRVASSIPDGEEQVSCSNARAAPLLRSILSKCSDAPSSLVEQLLSHTAEISDKSAAYRGDGVNPFAGDVSWSLLLFSSVIRDAAEIPVRRSAAYKEDIEKSMGEIDEWAKALSSQSLPHADVQLAVGTRVWAECPFNGHWYCAEVKAVESDKIQVQWAERPENVTGGHEDEYLIAVVGEFYNYEQFTSILAVAAVPLEDYERPAPAKEVSEEGWSRQLEAAEKLTEKFHKLKAVYEELGETTKNQKDMKKIAEVEKKLSAAAVKILSASSLTLRAMREDGERRQAAQGRGNALLVQATQLTQEIEEFVAKRLQTAESLDGAAAATASIRDAVAAACLEAERLRGRMLEELLSGLHAALYGEDAYELVQDNVTIGTVREIMTTARQLSDQAWKEAVQFAAETLDGPLALGCADMSRSATRYKQMRPELKKNLDRLATLERNAPMVPPTPKKKERVAPTLTRVAKETPGDAKSRPTAKKDSEVPSVLQRRTQEEPFAPDAAPTQQAKAQAQASLAQGQPPQGFATGSTGSPATEAAQVAEQSQWAAFPEVDFNSAAAVSADMPTSVQAPVPEKPAAPPVAVPVAVPAKRRAKVLAKRPVVLIVVIIINLICSRSKNYVQQRQNGKRNARQNRVVAARR